MSSTNADFPKVLFVNDYHPDSLLVADLSRQLLLGYPAERIAWWYWRTGQTRELRDMKVGSRHFWKLPERLVPTKKFARLKSAIMERLCIPLAARHLRRTIDEVKPDVVWVLLFGWPILVARDARISTKLHVSLWDMADTIAWQRTLGDARVGRMLEAVYGLIRQANSSDGISAPVLEEIEARTRRKDALLVHSGFEPHQLRALEQAGEAGAAVSDVLRLAYVGTIISEKSFQSLLAALDTVRAAFPKKVVLEFFGGRNYRSRAWFNPEWMTEHGVFSDPGLVEALRKCDWGIVVMDVEGEDLRYSRFSFPNKIGTYLSAGVPVLGYGHEQSSLAGVMRSHPVGKFTNTLRPEALTGFLQECLRLPTPRAFFREEILRCARSEFDADQIRRRLWKAWGVQFPDAS